MNAIPALNLFTSIAATGPKHLDMFLFLGVILILGYLGFVVAGRFQSPHVIAYLIMGLLLGRSVLNFINIDVYHKLEPISIFALAIVGFSIGGEMRYNEIKELGKTIPIITLFQAIGTFLLVAVGIALFTRNWALALLLGAISSATAPAATVSVLWQYGARGPLTTTIFAVVGLDDAAALIIYAFALSYAKVLFTRSGNIDILKIIGLPLLEIVGSIAIGIIIAYILNFALKMTNKKEELLIIVLGALLLSAGVARTYGFSMILTSMALGVTLINISPRNVVAFDLIGKFSNPFMVLLFVVVGAHLNIADLKSFGILGLIYIVLRSIGKISSSWAGAVVSEAEENVKKYLGLGLLSQAGVAIGLAIETSHAFSRLGGGGPDLGAKIMSLVAATVFVFELAGPVFVKYAIVKAGEADKAIILEDKK